MLQYLNNESNRLKTFVANRIALIHDLSSPSCWRYVNSKANQAHYASRGLRPTDVREVDQWINGPDFLRGKGEWPTCAKEVLSDETLEWKKDVKVHETQAQQGKPLDAFIQHYSSWYRLQKAVAWLIRFIRYLRAAHQARNCNDHKICNQRVFGPDESTGAGVNFLSVIELQNAKTSIIRYVQHESFAEEGSCLKRSSSSNGPSSSAVVKNQARWPSYPLYGQRRFTESRW